MSNLLTLAAELRQIDLRIGLDEALAVRRAGRERRSNSARKGWATRRQAGES